MYELHVEPLNRWYPKHQGRVENGTWQIQRVRVVEYITPPDIDFFTEYGQWHRFTTNGQKIKWDDLVQRLNIEGCIKLFIE